MFRGKESSNRIELSQLVQDLLNFGVLGSLRLCGWGVGGWGWGWVDEGGGWVDEGGGWWMGVGGGWMGVVGGCPPHMCTCTHGKHDNFMQMVDPIGGIP